jgi:hypothetical protein
MLSIRSLSPQASAGVLIFMAVLSWQTRPDFSGTWTFDEARSTQHVPGGVVIAKLLGDEVTIRQDASQMRLTIRIRSSSVEAIYALDGSESRNLSSEGGGKPDVTVTSRASWEGGTLVVRSTSTSEIQGKAVTTETKRVFSIDSDGNLILDRSGTPISEVPASRSVYKRARSQRFWIFPSAPTNTRIG